LLISALRLSMTFRTPSTGCAGRAVSPGVAQPAISDAIAIDACHAGMFLANGLLPGTVVESM
jgi:hypothetical protein